MREIEDQLGDISQSELIVVFFEQYAPCHSNSTISNGQQNLVPTQHMAHDNVVCMLRRRKIRVTINLCLSLFIRYETIFYCKWFFLQETNRL